MRTLVNDAQVVALCPADISLLRKLLRRALASPRMDAGEAYVATELLWELGDHELPKRKGGDV